MAPSVDVVAAQDKKLQQLNQKLKIFAEKLKAGESECARVVATLSSQEAMMQQLLDGQRADKATIAALRKEVFSLQKQLSEVTKRDSRRDGALQKLMEHAPQEGNAGGGEQETLIEVVRRMVEKRFAEEGAKWSSEVKRACASEQSKALKEWTASMSAAIGQRGSSFEGLEKVKEEVVHLGSRMQWCESRVGGPEAHKRDLKLMRACEDHVRGAVSSVVEKFNESSALSSRELYARLASIQDSIVNLSSLMREEQLAVLAEQKGEFDSQFVEHRELVNESIAQLRALHLQGHAGNTDAIKKLKAKMQELVDSLSGLASMRQSIEFILVELEEKNQGEEARDRALLDLNQNFVDGLGSLQELHDRLSLLERARPPPQAHGLDLDMLDDEDDDFCGVSVELSHVHVTAKSPAKISLSAKKRRQRENLQQT